MAGYSKPQPALTGEGGGGGGAQDWPLQKVRVSLLLMKRSSVDTHHDKTNRNRKKKTRVAIPNSPTANEICMNSYVYLNL